MKRLGILLGLLMVALIGQAQNDSEVTLTSSVSGNTYSMVTTLENYFLHIYSEKGADGNYTDGPYDRWIVIDSGECENEELGMSLYFDEFDIDPGDTLKIHDGAGIDKNVIVTCNNNLNPQIQTTVFPSPANMSGKLTLEFITNGDGLTGKGFRITVQCRAKCETIIPVIDSMYYKTRNGVIVDSAYSRMVMTTDTNWSADSSSYVLDTQWFRGMHLCLGEGIIFNAHGEYTNYYAYHPEDAMSMFEWNFGNGEDTAGIALTQAYAYYRDLDCYDVTLRLMDYHNCKSTVLETVKVRIAQNPIKTIYDLNTMCTTDSVIVNIGYEGTGSTITLTHIEFAQTKSKTIDCKTFIPDGPRAKNCGDPNKCFNATIHLDEFPPGRTVQSPADICSICINVEHEYLGDIGGRIMCPTGQKAILWYGTVGRDSELPNSDSLASRGVLQGMYGGSYMYLGIPYGGSNHHSYDEQCEVNGYTNDDYCDTICNMYGVGWDYCFSKNKDYILQTGEACNTTSTVPENYFCYSQANDTNVTNYTFDPVPAPYVQAGQQAPNSSFTTRMPSNHDEKTGYYLPATDLSNLVGCPLNGDWTFQLCDNFGSDNGWIFSWTIDFCGISAGGGCEYQVGIDSVIWEPDSIAGDFDLGYWRGLNIENSNPTRSVISSHDTAGYFPINVHIYDEFGCVWDTTTGIKTIWSPTPHLSDDDTLLICDVETVTLDAKDRHTWQDTTGEDPYRYTFKWEPFGQTTDTIETRAMMGSSTLYLVEAETNWRSTTCATRDSVRVNINRQPLPNFDPGVYPLEGCEPYTIHFENTSQFGDSYVWVFGDGDTSFAESPTHTYGTGQYDFKYFVKNVHGCNDSLVYSKLITVYSSPVARFSWEPMNPTVMHPSVTFQNLTIPQSDENRYYWEIQYDRDNPISYHTLRDVNPTFEWETDGEDITGNYTARLIAMTQTMGPSGNVVECRDTSESSILLVNDYLQFPNAVTPNGDGVNDKFIIRNLVNGLGYPNNSLVVYDRWGKRVFYKENISSEDDFWDPAKDNIPAGTYFWRFTGKGYLGDIQRNGVVEVIY